MKADQRPQMMSTITFSIKQFLAFFPLNNDN